MPNLEISFSEDFVVLDDYPFPQRNRGRKVIADEISEVVLNWMPPAIRTSDGEYLLVPAPQKEELIGFASRCGIPMTKRVDVWSFILEPFLDTEFTADQKARTMGILAESGVPEDEVARIRRLVNGPMLLWTAITWEWCHYGLYDVLSQMKPWGWWGRPRFARFYSEAMDLADRGAATPAIPAQQ